MGFGNSLYVFFHSDQSAKGRRGIFGEAGQELVSTSIALTLCAYTLSNLTVSENILAGCVLIY